MGLFKVKSKRSGEIRTVYAVEATTYGTMFFVFHNGEWEWQWCGHYEPVKEEMK